MQPIQAAKKIAKLTIDLLYPRRCPFCMEIITDGKDPVCLECRKILPYVKEPRCKHCSKPISLSEQEYCYDCSRYPFAYKRGIAVWQHKDQVPQSVYRFKYQNKREYAVGYTKELLRLHRGLIESWDADAIIPIPIHSKKYRQRGYNQAELLAKEIGRELDIPVMTDVVMRIKNTLPQKWLNSTERKNNLKMAFKIKNNGVELDKVILIDDIYTTGATVDAVSKLLLQRRVSEVYFISISIGQGM